jgi:hypothetical protein
MVPLDDLSLTAHVVRRPSAADVLFAEAQAEMPGFAFVVRSMQDRLSEAGADGRHP